jgi:hypothetical protein
MAFCDVRVTLGGEAREIFRCLRGLLTSPVTKPALMEKRPYTRKKLAEALKVEPEKLGD